MTKKKNNMLSAIRLWAITHNMEEITDIKSNTYLTDITFRKSDKICGFITEFDRESNQLKNEVIASKNFCDYVYIVVDDVKKGNVIKKDTPSFCGILCYSNPYSLGYAFRIFREPQLI